MRPAIHILFIAFLGVVPLAFCQEGTLSGTVVDSSGASIAHVQVKLTLAKPAPDRTTESADDGGFFLLELKSWPLSFVAHGQRFHGKNN